MTENALSFVCFEPRDGQFRAFLTMEDIITGREDPEVVLNQVAELYEKAIKEWKGII